MLSEPHHPLHISLIEFDKQRKQASTPFSLSTRIRPSELFKLNSEHVHQSRPGKRWFSHWAPVSGPEAFTDLVPQAMKPKGLNQWFPTSTEMELRFDTVGLGKSGAPKSSRIRLGL